MKTLDDISWMILDELQADSRLSYRELGRRVGLTPPAVAERVRWLERSGVIKGYYADLDLGKLGLPITAMVRATPNAGQKGDLEKVVTAIPEVRECLRVTGAEHVWMKISAQSLSHLDEVLHDVWDVADTTTNVVLSTLVDHRRVDQSMIPDEL
jgi:Lrp/AsnC family leucine-responsive transcriptional regulator